MTKRKKPTVLTVEEAVKMIEQLPIGTRVMNYGNDQSPALVNKYNDAVGGKFVPIIFAKSWWTDDLPEILEHYTREDSPMRGDIFVGLGGRYDEVTGHVGVVTGVSKLGKLFTTVEQYGESHRYVAHYTRNRDNVLGFLRPKQKVDE